MRIYRLLWLAIFGLGLAVSTASYAGPHLTEKLDYSENSIHNAQDPDFAAYWKDQLNLVDWQGKRGVIVYRRYFFNADGRRLFITMLSAGGVCGIRDCPVRILTESQQPVMEVMACDEAHFHEITADQLSFVACGVAHAIPQAGPRGAFETNDIRQYSHNGSVVHASFYKDGRVRMEYDELRKGLPESMHGAVLFEGGVDKNGNLVGTAYTFKSGCNAAPYAVRGRLDSKGGLVLIGDAPVRDPRSCDVLAFSARSPNARLAFLDIGWDQ
jgi:hypothetical protein